MNCEDSSGVVVVGGGGGGGGSGSGGSGSGGGSGGLSNALRFFHRSSSTQSNLVVDHDYHFEDFTNLNRTYDRINVMQPNANTNTAVNLLVGNSSSISSSPLSTHHVTSNVTTNHQINMPPPVANNHVSNPVNNSNGSTTQEESIDNFYELPYIDAASTYDFKQSSSTTNNGNLVQPAEPLVPKLKPPTAVSVFGGSSKANSSVLAQTTESFKFKTFSSRKYNPNGNYESSKRDSQLIGLVNPE